MLIGKLQEQLMEYDEKIKQNVRLSQRKKRLEFVTVNVSNIITVIKMPIQMCFVDRLATYEYLV